MHRPSSSLQLRLIIVQLKRGSRGCVGRGGRRIYKLWRSTLAEDTTDYFLLLSDRFVNRLFTAVQDFHPLLPSPLISRLEAACSPSFSPIFSRLFSRATTPQLHSAWVGSITIYRRQSRRKLRGVGSLFARPSLATRGLMPPAVLCDIPLRGWPGIVLLSRLPASR